MLSFEKTFPEKLAFDTPSIQLINFLRKHYYLNNFITQTNNFVIFKEFFVFTFFNLKEKVNYDQNLYKNKVYLCNDIPRKMANIGKNLIGII